MFSSKGEVNNMLVFKGSSMEDGNLFSKLTYFYDDFGDLRRNNQWSVETIKVKSDKEGEEDKKEDILCFNKYKDVQASSFRYMIPLIRLSEVYLIAAECSKTNEEASMISVRHATVSSSNSRTVRATTLSRIISIASLCVRR